MENTEIELQFKVENVQPLRELLERDAVFQYENSQVDEYFTPSDRDFAAVRPVDEWLRLRSSGEKQTINYKLWHRQADGKSYHCDEYETNVGDLSKMRKVFEALRFRPMVTVHKVRKVWMYKDYEISLDTVRGLGDFVEVEYKGRRGDVDPKQINDEMLSFVKSVGCGKLQISYQGYPFLLMFPAEETYEDVV